MTQQRDTLFRTLAMLQLIPRSPGFRATSTLCALLEERGFRVDMRTIQRDLEKLSSHFPLLCDKQRKPYRWSFDPAFKSNLPALDTPTALAWVLAESYLQNLLPQVAVEQLSNQFSSARKYLEQISENGFSHWSRQVKAIPNGKALIPAMIDPQVWGKVTDALLNARALDVTYLSRAKGEFKTFTLHPQGLVARHSVTYLLATVNEYDDIRQFALHRIQQASESGDAYKPKADFDLDDYLSQGAFGYPLDGKPVELVARVRPEVAWLLSETPVSEIQQLSEPDTEGWVTLTATLLNDQQTLWWIMGFGASIQVIEPASWRDMIYQNAQQIVDWQQSAVV